MNIQIVSDTQNALLKRREVRFQIEHGEAGSTPKRQDVRTAVAAALKMDVNLIFVKKVETKTGTLTATGLANVYDSFEQAKSVEPEYLIKRNVPPEKPKEEQNKEEGKV